MGEYELDSFTSAEGEVACCCDYGNKPSGSINRKVLKFIGPCIILIVE
jgi:hypothetical protein